MAKTKSNQKTVRTGLIFVTVWLLVAALVMTASADTSGSGSTSSNEFSWSWETDNKNNNAAGTFSGSVTDGNDGRKTLTLNISASSSTYVAGSDGCGGIGATEPVYAADTINTATVTNNTGSTLSIVDIGDSSVTCSVLVGDKLANGDSFKVSITAGPNGSQDATARENKGSIAITFETVEKVDLTYYGADGVSYKYGEVVLDAASDKTTMEVEVGSKITLPAAPNVSSGTFAGWRLSHDGSLHSAEETVVINNDTTVYPVVVPEGMVAPFTVNGTSYTFWTDAAKAAGSNGTIILNQNYTLPTTLVANGVSPSGTPYIAGTDGNVNFIIPSGVTLLIPYDAANTLCTTAPTMDDNAYTAPSVYRTLTMANGANITVNGAISVSGKQSSKYGYNGMPSGPLGFIHMNSGSTITINSGASLYAWGYIKGAGSVTVNNGATVYECFQIADYRGGDATSSIVGQDDEYGVLPFNQYYLQNVEVPMTLYAGAKLNGHGAVSVTGVGTQVLNVPFIGASDSMFVLNSGYIVKDYIEGTGRTELTLNGEMTLTEVNMGLKVSFLGTLDIDTSKYALPIPNHITLLVNSGGKVTMNQSVAFLPGSELYIENGAQCILCDGKKLYVYDLDQWLYNNGVNGYAGTGNLPYMQLNYVPGGDATTGRLKDALIQVDGEADLSAGSAYVTESGANIYSTGTGVVKVQATTATTAYQVITNNTAIGSWPSIKVIPLVLKNADGSTVSATGSTASEETVFEYPYYASTGRWDKPGHFYDEGVVTAPTCTATGFTTHTCEACGHSYKDTEVAALGHTEVIDEAVASTCIKNGKAEGSHCSVCKKVLVAQLDQPMIAHDLTKLIETVTATCTTPGYKVYECSGCGLNYRIDYSAPGHNWDTNGQCTVDGCTVTKAPISVYATNIKAGDSLDIYFYVLKSDDLNCEDYQAVLVRTSYDEDYTTITIPGSAWTSYGDDYYRFCYTGIAAKEMGDEVYVTLQKIDDNQASATSCESVSGYAHRVLARDDEKLRTALVDMLNYGSACQTFFAYDTTDLVNADLDETQKSYATQTENMKLYDTSNYANDGNMSSISVSAKNELVMTFFLASTQDRVINSNSYAHISYTDHYGKEVYQTFQLGNPQEQNGNMVYKVTLNGLAIADGRQVITCLLSDSPDKITNEADSASIIGSGTYSVECFLSHKVPYADREKNPDSVYVMLMKFVDSAYAYFHSAP